MIDNIVLPFIFGALIKGYDDIFDNTQFHKLFSDMSIELIKTFTICIYTLISIKNVNIPFIIFISHILFYMIDNESINNPFFISGMLISVFLCIFNFNRDSFNIKRGVITIATMIIAGWIDHILFPEESSIKKIIGRTAEIGISFVLYSYFKEYFIDELIVFTMGYGITSIVNMSILEFNNTKVANKPTADSKTTPTTNEVFNNGAKDEAL